ncbi:PQQ-binding-like beta-propeller repeat protein [bacterium]|nr:PQQ-binding-like beta-propeller repeat protein [bacterium]
MRPLLFILALFVFSLVGCSSSSNNPTTPQSDGISVASDIGSALGMLGAYELSINPENNTAELTAKRTNAIGESYIVSGIGFFTISPCPDCFKIKGISMTPEGFIALTFSIRHPFDPGDTLKPPTAINRLDLDVFDLTLVIAPKETIPEAFSLGNAYAGICVDTDGYTTELSNLVEDTASLPYYLVIDDSIGGISTFNKFKMGEETEFDVILDLSGSTLLFDLYLTMGYGFSAVKADRLHPAYYNPEFNRKSAWKVVVTPPEGDDPPALGNTWQHDDSTTPFSVTVEVYDWQIGANVDPALTNPDDIYAASGVSAVSMEIPGMTAAYATVNTPDSGTGMPDDPLVYTISMANENLLEAGEYTGLIKVTDERLPLAPPPIDSRDYLIDSPDGVVLENYEIPEYAAYQIFTATVVEGVSPLEGWLCYSHDPQHTGVADCVLDPAALELKWAFPTGGDIKSSPVISAGITYFGSDDANVYAVDLATGTEVWSYTADMAVCGTAAIGEDAIYIGTEGGYLYSLLKSDGSEIWNYQFTFTGMSGADGLKVRGAILVDGRVYFCANNGSVYALNATDGSEIFVVPTPLPSNGNSLRTVPAYYEAEDQLIVTADSYDVICFDAFDGTEYWRKYNGEFIGCSPTLDGDYLYFFDDEFTRKYELSGTASPTLIWEEALNPHPFVTAGSGALDDGHYYTLTLIPGKLLANDRDTGTIDWFAPPELIQGFSNAPAVSGGVVYFASTYGVLYGYDTATGTEVFNYDIGEIVDGSSVAIHDDRLLVGCCDGSMYCFGEV